MAQLWQYLLLGTFLCTGLFWSCSELTPPPFEPIDLANQHRYFPLEIGKFSEYYVDSIVYDFAPGGGILRDSTHRLIREEIADTFRDQTGLLVYRIERFERADTSQPWQLIQVFSSVRTNTQAMRTEHNLRFLKLVFPFDRFTSWDGNLWIDQYQDVEIAGERMRPFVNWNYRVDSLDFPAQIGPFTFDSVLVVTEVDATNAIERRLSRSKYAKGVGLVWREQWILDSQYCNQVPPPADCLSKAWQEKAEAGYILRQVVTGFN